MLIEADSEWALKLRSLKEQSPPEELEQYSFVLANATRGGQRQCRRTRARNCRSRMSWPRTKKLNKVYTERKD